VPKFNCKTCGQSHEFSFTKPDDWWFCNNACYTQYERAVDLLGQGPTPEALGIEPGSRLHREAQRDLERQQQREWCQDRERAEKEYAANRPRKFRPLYPCTVLLVPFAAAVVGFMFNCPPS
jgi:hypothetical protein